MQVKELADGGGALIVDAREPSSFAAGHISGARSLPLGEAGRPAAARFREDVPKGKTIIVYCNGFSCHDSLELGKLLMKWGYPAVYVYEGGYPEWRDAGYPVERGTR